MSIAEQSRVTELKERVNKLETDMANLKAMLRELLDKSSSTLHLPKKQ